MPDGGHSLKTNKIPITISIMANVKLPKRTMVFLPNLSIIFTELNAPKREIALIIIGT